MLSSVDLPQPDGPSSVTNSPGATERLNGASARVPFGKTFSALRTSTTGKASALRALP
jgi:hypothetical protein